LSAVHPHGGYRRGALCLACLARTPGATLADRLLAHRLAAGLTQKELAARVGTTKNVISGYELELYRARPAKLRRLAKVLGAGVLADVPGVAP
jgi:ribosome-binding protein aMBF1 (putative translation factor)